MPRTGIESASKVGPAVSTTQPWRAAWHEETLEALEQFSAFESIRPCRPRRSGRPPRAEHGDAVGGICATLRCVGDSTFGGSSGRRSAARARQAQRAEQVVGVAVSEAGEEIGSPGATDGIGVAAEVDVRHGWACASHRSDPQPGAGKRLVVTVTKRAPPSLSTIGPGAGLAEQAHQLGRLVFQR